MNEDFQRTSDPEAADKVAKLQAELGGKMHNGTVEMFSGITYSGFVSGNYFGERTTGGGKTRRVGGFIVLDTKQDGKVRLDALDIKSWSLTPFP